MSKEKKVGKKVKPGSKGPEPTIDVEVEKAKARLAKKRETREAERKARIAELAAVANDLKTGKPREGKKADKAREELRAIHGEHIAANIEKRDAGAEEVDTEKGRAFIAPAVSEKAQVEANAAKNNAQREVLKVKKARETSPDVKRRMESIAELRSIIAGDGKKKLKKEAQADLDAILAEVQAIVSAPVSEAEVEAVAAREETEKPKAKKAKAEPVVEAPAETVAIAVPSDTEEWPVRHKGNGNPKILLPGEEVGGKEAFYSRVTTYIDCLDDKTTLARWGRRVVLSGAALDGITDVMDEGDPADTIIGKVAAANAALAEEVERITKKAAKGKYGVGGQALDLEVAQKAHKDALDTLADQAFDLGDGFARTQKGTDLHAYTELIDSGQPLPEDISDVDRADIEAYAAEVKRWGLVHVASEQFIVNDEFGVAGTYDRIWKYKRPGAARAIQVVGDLKTGRIDLGTKIPMQLAAYAGGVPYTKDAEKHRGPAVRGLSRNVGLLIHLVQGKGICTIHEVDLTVGLRGLRIAAEVRKFRTEGNPKHTFESLDDLLQRAGKIEAEKAAEKLAATPAAE